MAQINNNRLDFYLEGVTLKLKSPKSLHPEFTVPVIEVVFRSFVHRYALDEYDHSSATVASPNDLVPVRTDESTATECACDFRRLPSSTEILSKSMSAANPNIRPGTKVHDDIVDEIFRCVNDNYSDPEVYINQHTVLTHLTLEFNINEHVLDQCECEECVAIRESALMAEREAEKLLKPATESSIKKLKRVRVVAADAADLEEDHEDRQRKRRRSKSDNKVAARPSDRDDCTICCYEFTAGKYVSRMPCLHSFHRPCIQKWLRRSHYCPMCRYEMPVALDGQEDGFDFHLV